MEKCYIVAELPEWDHDIVILSSTWVTGEVNSDGLPTTRLPSLPSYKYNNAVERHAPCSELDRVYAYRERCRCAAFTDAKAMEQQLSSNSEMSSDATVTMGLPRKRKIKRKMYSSDEELPTTSTVIQRPAHVDFVLPTHGRYLIPDNPQQSPTASPPFPNGTRQITRIPRLQSPQVAPPFRNGTRPVTPIPRLQSPPATPPFPNGNRPITPTWRFQSPTATPPFRNGTHPTTPTTRNQSTQTTKSLENETRANTPIQRLQSPTPVANESRPSTSRSSRTVYEEQSLAMLTNITREIANMKRLMARLWERQDDRDRSSNHPDAGGNTQHPSPMLPAYTMEDVIAIDANLADRTYFRQLSDEFLTIPGSDLRTAVRNILCRLISPSMSEVIHCRGRDKPYVFKNSRLYGFLLDNLRRRPAFAHVQDNKVAFEARLWFRLHRERVGRASQVVPLSLGREDDGSDKENESDDQCGDLGEWCA